MEEAFTRLWQRDGLAAKLLSPLSAVYRDEAARRRIRDSEHAAPLSIPVVVVGNITVGGTGKTPVLIALVEALQQRGYRPAVISRGYLADKKQRKKADYPMQVSPQSEPSQCGDEPLLIAQSVNCPVVVDPERRRAAQWVIEHTDANVILSDDGLQHYRLFRDVEIVVFDASRGIGNGRLLPAGPLREPVSRLQEVDLVLANGDGDLPADIHLDSRFHLAPVQFRHLQTGRVVPVKEWQQVVGEGSNKVHAVAGIGNPARFANTLRQIGFDVALHPKPDHHSFSLDDLGFNDSGPVIVTAKDAVKCLPLLRDQSPKAIWALDVKALLEDQVVDSIINKIS